MANNVFDGRELAVESLRISPLNSESKFTVQHKKNTTEDWSNDSPIRELLVKNTAWTWGPTQQDSFDKIKKALTSAPILTLYDPNKATKIAADASSYGLGAVVLQEDEPDTWKPVSFISRSMTTTEARYAQIEKEALAVTWACERSSNYIIGKTITIETDHKPLVPLLTNHTIDKLPPRLQRYKMRLMRFHIKDVRHVPGKLHYTADTRSRKIPESTVQPTVEENEMNAYVLSVIDALPASNPRLKEIQQAQDEDEYKESSPSPTGYCSKEQDWSFHPACNAKPSTKYTKVTKVSANAENEPKYPFGGQDSVPKLKSWSKTVQHAANSDSSRTIDANATPSKTMAIDCNRPFYSRKGYLPTG
ncbi:Hypothetical predicted protein, partial [Paramuricea clavata]